MNRYVSVRFQKKGAAEEFSGQEYTYIDGLGLMLDDLVQAPTAKGKRIAKVTRVNVPEDEIDRRYRSVLKTITTLHDEEGDTDNGE